MQPQQRLRLRPLWLALGWLLVAAVWYLSLTSRPPQIDLGIRFFDKISHFVAYASMMFWFMQLYQRTPTRLWYAVGFICMGIALEFIQGMGQYRLFEYADMLANSLGVLASLVLMYTPMNQSLYWLERKLAINRTY